MNKHNSLPRSQWRLNEACVHRAFDTGYEIRAFRFEKTGKDYTHRFYNDDDSVDLVDEDGKTQLVYDSSTNVLSVADDGRLVPFGKLSIVDDFWVFINLAGFVVQKLEHSRGAESCLNSEVCVSKLFLSM